MQDIAGIVAVSFVTVAICTTRMRVTMHGEYKMPGGKLVVADFDVRGGKLTRVRISGDFFLEPDSALTLIDVALEGLPATADGETLAGAVQATLGPNVRMYGISAEAIAVAVRRALEASP